MIIMKIVGLSKSEFTPENSTTPIHGYNMFVVYEQNNVEGHAAQRIYVKKSVFDQSGAKVGNEIMLNYNQYGKPQEIVVTK